MCDAIPTVTSASLLEANKSTQGTELQCHQRLRNKQLRMTGIVCTLGKSTKHVDVLSRMIEEGMTIAHLNFTYGTVEVHRETVKLLRKAIAMLSKSHGYTVQCAIAVSTPGPEIRTGNVDFNIPIQLQKGEYIKLTTLENLHESGTSKCVYINYPNITKIVQPGHRLFIPDGGIELTARRVNDTDLICEITKANPLGSFRKVMLLDTPTGLPEVTAKDCQAIKFAIDQNLDMIFASKIRNVSTLQTIRKELGAKGTKIKVLAEIESEEGLNSLHEIMAACDGIILARHDCSINLPLGKSFLIQKSLLVRCNRAGKPVIVSNYILNSMCQTSRPPCPEAMDVGTAVLDGTSHIMLSSPTAIGRFPVECVKVLTQMCLRSECMLRKSNMYDLFEDCLPPVIDAMHTVAIEAASAAKKANAAAIIVHSRTGRMAALIAKFRPPCPIFAVTTSTRGGRQSLLHRGVVPILYKHASLHDWVWEMNVRTYYAMMVGRKLGAINVGDPVVVVSQWRDASGFTNSMRILEALVDTDKYECVSKDPAKPVPKLPRFDEIRYFCET